MLAKYAMSGQWSGNQTTGPTWRIGHSYCDSGAKSDESEIGSFEEQPYFKRVNMIDILCDILGPSRPFADEIGHAAVSCTGIY